VWRKHGVEWDEERCDLGRNCGVATVSSIFSAPFYPLVNRDHNSDSIVYIDHAWITRINVESILYFQTLYFSLSRISIHFQQFNRVVHIIFIGFL
jgi:hypothetical protein